MPDVPPPKPWSIDVMERWRPHLCNFVRTELIMYLNDATCRRIIIRAPVKSGKREIVEYIAIRDRVNGRSMRVHVFISAWHRTADNEQRDELHNHNLMVFSINSRANVAKCIRWIQGEIAAGKDVVLHLDECDHGAGERQLLSHIWRSFRANEKVTNILYSATPEEVLFSRETDNVSIEGDDECDDAVSMVEEMLHEGVLIRYDPPAGYCGPAKFLDEHRVFQANPFFAATPTGMALTPQGRQIIHDMRESMLYDPRRNILVLRLSYSVKGGVRAQKKANKAIYQFISNIHLFPELSDFTVIVDKDDGKIPTHGGRILVEKINWSSTPYWRCKAANMPILIVIDQTSSRSTEWKCHDRIFALHDYRNTVSFSVVSQAQERVNHYAAAYGGFQPIRVYGNMKTWMLSAGRIDYATYLTNDWKKHKIDRRIVANNAVLYYIQASATNLRHPVYNTHYTEERADEILHELDCFTDMIISARVKGGIDNVPIYASHFEPCNADSFMECLPRLLEAAMRTEHPFQNPFDRAETCEATGRIKGYLRGPYVLDYDTQVKNMGWGVGPTSPRLTICYQANVLGVAIRWDTGVREHKDTLSAYKSMFGTRV